MDMEYQVLIQNIVWEGGVIMVMTSGRHWLADLVVTTSCNFGATIILIYRKGDWGTVHFCTSPKDRQTQLIRGSAGSWIHAVWFQELLAETQVCLNTNRVSQSYGSDRWQHQTVISWCSHFHKPDSCLFHDMLTLLAGSHFVYFQWLDTAVL